MDYTVTPYHKPKLKLVLFSIMFSKEVISSIEV